MQAIHAVSTPPSILVALSVLCDSMDLGLPHGPAEPLVLILCERSLKELFLAKLRKDKDELGFVSLGEELEVLRGLIWWSCQ